ncbi:MAG: hypothetical protein V4463_17850 [Pseudomonadota bacterium]
MHRLITTALLASALLAGAAPAADFDNVRGSYVLEDGRSLSICQSGRRLYAELDGQARIEIVATAASSFAARDGSLALHFAQHANGSVSGVQLRQAAPLAGR